MVMKEYDCNNVLILWSSRYDYEEGWRLQSHVHNDFYQLIYCICGTGNAIIEKLPYNLRQNVALLLKPGTWHEIDNIGRAGLKTLDVKFIIGNDALARDLEEIPYCINDCPNGIQRKLERINYEGKNKMYGYIQQSQLYLSMILLDIIRMFHCREIVASQSDIFYDLSSLSSISVRTIAFIEKNFDKHIVSYDFEKGLNFSYRYLSQNTVRDTGYSPIELLDRYRCYIAVKYLSAGILNIKQISELVGYSDVHHFTRTFCRIEGKPPARYRRDVLSIVRKDFSFVEGFENTNNTLC